MDTAVLKSFCWSRLDEFDRCLMVTSWTWAKDQPRHGTYPVGNPCKGFPTSNGQMFGLWTSRVTRFMKCNVHLSLSYPLSLHPTSRHESIDGKTRSHTIHILYIYLHLPENSTIHVGKYASPMDGMGMNLLQVSSRWFTNITVIWPILFISSALLLEGDVLFNIYEYFLWCICYR